MVEVVFEKVVFREIGQVAGLDAGQKRDVRGITRYWEYVDHGDRASKSLAEQVQGTAGFCIQESIWDQESLAERNVPKAPNFLSGRVFVPVTAGSLTSIKGVK